MRFLQGKFVLKTAVISTLLIAGCSKNYDYSGSYDLTSGDNCTIEEGENSFITVSPVQSEEGALYTARLTSKLSAGGIFPVESKPSKKLEDGSIVFSFFKEGKSGFFSSKPSVDMQIKLIEKDNNHIIAESWKVSMSAPKKPSLGGQFDFIKDDEIKMMGKSAPNEMNKKAGTKGLCLKKIAI